MTALPLLVAAVAAAAPVFGWVSDPVDGAGTPAQDIVHASSSFDGSTGDWELVLRLRAPATTEDAARVHGILYREDPARPGICPSDDVNAELGRLQASTDPARDDQFFNSVGSTGATHALKWTSADGRELTFDVRPPELVGATAVCASASLSKGRPLDVLDRPIIMQPGFTPPPSRGGETPAAAAPRIALASRTVAVSRGAATVKLEPFAARTTLRVRVSRNGTTLAVAQRTVSAERAVKLRIRLSRAGRRLMARHRRARVKLSASAVQTGRPRGSRSFKVTLKRS